MIKRTAVILIAALTLALCGCTSTETVDTATVSSTTGRPTTQPTTEPTSSTTQPTTAGTTQSATLSTQPHVHSYASAVVKKASCTADGTKKFTCACGDSYTETVKAKGHTWGQWLQIVATNTLDPTGTYRVCSACKAEERSVNYSTMLKKYTTLVGFLNSYSSPDAITATEAAASLPMILSVLPEFTDDPSVATRTYKVSDMNACASRCFGRTFDFTGIMDVSVHGYGTMRYDASTDALVWTFPYGQDHTWYPAVMEKFTASDSNTKFIVFFHYDYNGGSSPTYSFDVELQNGSYVITSISK